MAAPGRERTRLCTLLGKGTARSPQSPAPTARPYAESKERSSCCTGTAPFLYTRLPLSPPPRRQSPVAPAASAMR